MFGGHSDSWNPSYAAYGHPEFPYAPYYVDPASVHPSMHYGSAPNLAAMNLAGPPPPPPPPSEPLPTSSSGYPNLVQVNRTVSHQAVEHDYSANMDYMADVTSFPTYDSRGSVNDRVRCATPTFEGSGEPIVAGKEHDEIRPLIVTCMSSEQLEMCSKLNRCLNELSIFHGLKGINDIADGSERPGKEDDEMRKYPSKGVHDEDIDSMYRTNSDRPARSVTQTGDNSTMVTVVNTGTTLIRKHKKMAKDSPSNLQVTTTVADSRPASSSHSPAVETDAVEDNGGMLPLPTLSSCLASKQSGSYYNNYNGKKSAMKWVRPLTIRPEKPLSVPEKEKDDGVGSAAINKRRLELLSYVDWWSDNIPQPKKMTVEVKNEVNAETADTPENRRIKMATESATSPEETSHSTAGPTESARTPGDERSAATPDPAESGDPSPPGGVDVPVKVAAVPVNLPAPSLAPSRFKPAFTQPVEKKAGIPRQTARSKINRGRGAMSLRIINGHRIGGDSRECYANLQGKCTAGIFCRFEHGGSTEHQEAKICARLLRGVCRPSNPSCPLDHLRLLPHQYPVCQFFLREDCADGATCQLVHVKHAPRSTVCQEFQQGVCTRGDECEYPHRYSYAFVKERGEYAERNMLGSSSERVATPEDDERVLKWIED